MCPKSLQKRIGLLLAYSDNTAISDEVPDPYYGEGDGFQYVYELILEAAHGLLAVIKDKHKL
jgi:protein-tyrosine phosphatase